MITVHISVDDLSRSFKSIEAELIYWQGVLLIGKQVTTWLAGSRVIHIHNLSCILFGHCSFQKHWKCLCPPKSMLDWNPVHWNVVCPDFLWSMTLVCWPKAFPSKPKGGLKAPSSFWTQLGLHSKHIRANAGPDSHCESVILSLKLGHSQWKIYIVYFLAQRWILKQR